MKKGFAALSLILIISAVMLTVIGTISYMAIGEGQASLALEQGEDNLGYVEGCVEYVLQKIHDDPTFALTSVTHPGGGTCVITYALSGPTNWDMTVTALPNGLSRKIRVVFTVGVSAINITSWQEV